MSRGWRCVLVLLLALLLAPLALFYTLGGWLPTLAGIWLPEGTRIDISQRITVSRNGIHLPVLRYLAGECELAKVENAQLSHPSRWQLTVGALTLNPSCIANIPPDAAPPQAPRTLAQWQAMLPQSWVTIDNLLLTTWPDYRGKLRLALSPEHQQVAFSGERLAFNAALDKQQLAVTRLSLQLEKGQAPLALNGSVTLPLIPDNWPTQGQLRASFSQPGTPKQVDAELNWQQASGQLLVIAPDAAQPLLDLPWQLSADVFSISDGRWFWPYLDMPLSGRINLSARDYLQGLEKATLSGRLSLLTQGHGGKGNIVVTLGPGKLSAVNSAMPLRATGQVNYDNMIFYAMLPATLSGPYTAPALRFNPGALLRTQGRLVDSLNIDAVRLPLAGVSVTQRGIDGRLQAILQAHEAQRGNFTLHLDGKAEQFSLDKGLWRWRYWGKGYFDPMQANWDVDGTGQWHDTTIKLNQLTTGFDRLQYGGTTVANARLVLTQPVIWARASDKPTFSGALRMNTGKTTFASGGALPGAEFTFRVEGRDPTHFQYHGDLHAGEIGPAHLAGRWDGERLRGQAWWPRQSLIVLQPLIAPDSKLTLKSGTMDAMIAFSAAAGQGLEAGGHISFMKGSAWLPDNQINGVTFVLPFRYNASGVELGTKGPVRLRIAEIQSQFPATDFRANLRGHLPWSDDNPLELSDVSVNLLGGKLWMQQLRFPQRDAALLRIENLSTSHLITALNMKQFTLSGRINGALPLWLNHPKWLVKDGWITNPGALTLRLDKDMADRVTTDNMAAGVGIDWLRYMEVSRSWTHISVDNLGVLRMTSTLQGISQHNGVRSPVTLNYTHQENLFTLWRSLRFGDNLQAWLEQSVSLPDTSRCSPNDAVCKENTQ